MQRQGSKSPTN